MAVNKKTDEEAIRQVIKKMFDSYMNKDMESMLSCYTDDLVVLPQVGDPIYGLKEWQAFVAPRGFEPSDQQIKAADYHLQEIKVAGDWAWVSYLEWKSSENRESGAQRYNYIKAVNLLERQSAGDWKISKYIWNRIQHEGEPAAHMKTVLSKTPTGLT